MIKCCKKIFIWVLLVGGLVGGLVGCATSPKYDDQKQEGQWEAKAQVRNLKKGESQNITLDFIARWPDRFRLEVTGPLGVQLASVVMDGESVSYLLYQQKKYYSGKTSNNALYPIFRFHLPPTLLMNVMFDRVIEDKSWICTLGEAGKVDRCSRASGIPLTIVWTDRQEELKKVLISGVDFEVQVLIKSFSAKVQNRPDLYQLSVPAQFRKYRLK